LEEGALVNPLEPRPPGPENVMPQAWGIRLIDEECASERRTDKPLGEAWLQARPPGMRGGGHWAYQGYSIARSVNVKDYRVAGVGVKEHYSMTPPIPRTITLDIILDMENYKWIGYTWGYNKTLVVVAGGRIVKKKDLR
jgi:hypothetical protein